MIAEYLTQNAPLRLRALAQSHRIAQKAKSSKDLVEIHPDGASFGAEFKHLSQNGEDGLIQQVLSTIGVTNRLFCEFGFSTIECNSILLAEASGFGGLWIDGNADNCEVARQVAKHRGWSGVSVTCAFITTDNINQLVAPLVARAGGPIDVLTTDIDGNDYWIFEAITELKSRLLVMEYNAAFGPNRSVTVPYVSNFFRGDHGVDGLYFGASLTALSRVAERKGYRLIGTDQTGTNAFFLAGDLGIDKFPTVAAAAAFRPLRYWLERGIEMEEGFRRIKHLPLVTIE